MSETDKNAELAGGAPSRHPDSRIQDCLRTYERIAPLYDLLDVIYEPRPSATSGLQIVQRRTMMADGVLLLVLKPKP